MAIRSCDEVDISSGRSLMNDEEIIDIEELCGVILLSTALGDIDVCNGELL